MNIKYHDFFVAPKYSFSDLHKEMVGYVFRYIINNSSDTSLREFVSDTIREKLKLMDKTEEIKIKQFGIIHTEKVDNLFKVYITDSCNNIHKKHTEQFAQLLPHSRPIKEIMIELSFTANYKQGFASIDTVKINGLLSMLGFERVVFYDPDDQNYQDNQVKVVENKDCFLQIPLVAKVQSMFYSSVRHSTDHNSGIAIAKIGEQDGNGEPAVPYFECLITPKALINSPIRLVAESFSVINYINKG